MTLVNVVFEIDDSLIKNDKVRNKYVEAIEREHQESEKFLQVMLAKP